MSRISVLIPAYRVKGSLRETLDAVLLSGSAHEVIVVDDHCPEDSWEEAQIPGVTLIRLPANLGKGGALTEGLKASRGDVIVLLDGDLGSSASEWVKLVPPILEGVADMTIAVFAPAVRVGGFGFAKGLASFTIRFHTGLDCKSPMSGQRAMRRSVAEALGRFESGWGIETAMTIDVHRMGFKVVEVPTDMTHAETGRDIAGFKHRYGQFKAVAKVFASRIFHRRRRIAG